MVVFSIWFSEDVVAVLLFSNFVTFPSLLSKKHVPNVYGEELSSRNVSNTHV